MNMSRFFCLTLSLVLVLTFAAANSAFACPM
jgi:hypothetical protein